MWHLFNSNNVDFLHLKQKEAKVIRAAFDFNLSCVWSLIHIILIKKRLILNFLQRKIQKKFLIFTLFSPLEQTLGVMQYSKDNKKNVK